MTKTTANVVVGSRSRQQAEFWRNRVEIRFAKYTSLRSVKYNGNLFPPRFVSTPTENLGQNRLWHYKRKRFKLLDPGKNVDLSK